MLSRNRKIFVVSSLILNLFAFQIGEFFLPHSVYHSINHPQRTVHITPKPKCHRIEKKLRNLRPSIVRVVAWGRLVSHDVSVLRTGTGTKFKDQ